MVCVEDPKKIVLEKMRKSNSMTWKRKQANWPIVTAALVINKVHMSDCHTTLNKTWTKNQSNDTKGKNLPND